MSALPFLLALALTPADVPEWGGFRGNNGAGVAESPGLPDKLSAEACGFWEASIPPGYSSPSIAGDRVFLTAAEGTELSTICLDRATGEERWVKTIEFSGKRTGANSPAAPSPVTDGTKLFVCFHDIGLLAYDLEGTELWRNEMPAFDIPHGMSTSPVVHGELVILLVDQDSKSELVAFEKETGEVRWRTEREGTTHSYSTPTIYAPEQAPAQVIVSGSFQIAGYDVETGAKIWWANGAAWQTKSVPAVVGDTCIVNAYMVPSTEFGVPALTQSWEEILEEKDADEDGFIAREEWNDIPMLQQAWFIFDLDNDEVLDREDYEYLVASGHATGGLFAIKLDGEGDITDTHIAWKYDQKRGLPDIPSPLVMDGVIYLIKEGGIFTSIDATTGEVVKQGRIGEPDRYYASPVAAAGRIVTASHGGQLSVVSTGDEWEVVSSEDLQEEVWSTPAIAGDQVFIRTQFALYCFKTPSREG